MYYLSVAYVEGHVTGVAYQVAGLGVRKTTFHSTLKGLAPIFRAASTVL